MFKKIFILAVCFFSSVSNGYAFNFGFVRVPDWMDSYFLYLIALLFVGFIGFQITKPKGIPAAEIKRDQLSTSAKIFQTISVVSVFALIALMFGTYIRV